MLKNNEPANKLAHYSNIQASVEKLTDEKTIKQRIKKHLNPFQDDKLRKINNCDLKVLDIVFYNYQLNLLNNALDSDIIDGPIKSLAQGTFDKIIDANPDVLGIMIKRDYLDFNQMQTLNSLSDYKFYSLMKEVQLIDALLKIGDTSLSSFIRVLYFITDENFKGCINNKDLILVYCLTSKKITTNLKNVMLCSDRNSMIDKLYELQQKGKLYCDKKSLDLILSNLPIVEQLLYNDIDGSVIETLQSGSDEEIKTLLESVQENIQQKTRSKILFIRYHDQLNQRRNIILQNQIRLKCLLLQN